MSETMTDTTIKNLATVFPLNPQTLKTNPAVLRRRSILREFSLNTSTHGLPGIARSQSIPNCIFWIVVFLSFTGIMLYFVTESISSYFQYETQTSVTFDAEWPQPFPAVTICNYSPLRYDQFIEPYLNYTNALNITNTNDTNTFTSTQALYVNDFLQYKINAGESISDYFYPLSAMLMKCVYNGLNCSVDNFTYFTSPVYGRCYTFNAKSNKTNNGEVHYNNENGGRGNLELRLYAQSHQYVPYFSDGVGMMAMLHDNVQMPLIDLTGIQLAPGRKHKLGYHKKTSYFLSEPYTSCTKTVTPGMQALFDQFPGSEYAYEEETCFEVCLQSFIYHACGCVNPFAWAYRSVVLPGTTTVINALLCNISDTCYGEAAGILRASESITTEYCGACAQSCSTVEFMTTSSSISAPPQWLLSDIKEFVESSSIPLPANWSTTWTSEIQANYVAINVVCESTNIDNYTQTATLTAVDVISNVGGQTGLWIGISFLSLMEVAEMLFRLARSQCRSFRRRR